MRYTCATPANHRHSTGPMLMIQRSTAILLAAILMTWLVASCSGEQQESATAYQAACQGPPLRTVELRNKAMEDGYDINRRHDCIDKASFVAVNEERTKWEAANTPEAIAKSEAEFAEKRARYAGQRAREEGAEKSPTTEA